MDYNTTYLYLPTFSDTKAWDFYPGCVMNSTRHDHSQRFPKTSEDLRRLPRISEGVLNSSEGRTCIGKHDLVQCLFFKNRILRENYRHLLILHGLLASRIGLNLDTRTVKSWWLAFCCWIVQTETLLLFFMLTKMFLNLSSFECFFRSIPLSAVCKNAKICGYMNA